MKIIFDLFGVHIAFISVILFLLIAWLFWPRKRQKSRKLLIGSAGLVLLIGILLALRAYWPYSYEKHYLNSSISPEIKSTPLRELADSVDFYIGMAIGQDSEFKEVIAREFNSAVAENDFKPGRLLVDPVNWKFDFTKADQLLEFTESHGMRMRGHALIWGKFPGMTYPKEWGLQVSKASDKKKELETIIIKYIETVMGHFKGRVPTWDVVNEPMRGEGLYQCLFTETLGEEYIDLSFKAAHQVDPECLLILNEQIQDYDGPSGQAFLKLLERLVARKVPIHGVGLQSHHINKMHDLGGLRRYVRAIGKLGLKVEITELDIRLLLLDGAEDPYASQGVQFGGITKICLDDPACIGLTLWGLTDGNNWMDNIAPFRWKSPNAPNIFDEKMHRKPAYVSIWESLKQFQEKY